MYWILYVAVKVVMLTFSSAGTSFSGNTIGFQNMNSGLATICVCNSGGSSSLDSAKECHHDEPTRFVQLVIAPPTAAYNDCVLS